MIKRYTRPAMGRIWTEDNKYRCWLQVESAASAVLAEDGVIPQSAADAIANKASASAERIHEIEAEVKHDIIAFTTAVAESLKAQGLGEAIPLAALWPDVKRCRRHRAGSAGKRSIGSHSKGN